MRKNRIVALLACVCGLSACAQSEDSSPFIDAGVDVARGTGGTGGNQQPTGSGGSGTGSGGFAGTGGSSGSGGGTGGGTGGSGGMPVDAPVSDDASSAGDAADASADQASGDDASDGGDASVDQVSVDDAGFPIGGPIGSCLPLKWVATASNSATGDPPANALDGFPATRWSTGIAQKPGLQYQIDFGGFVRLSQVRLDSSGSPVDYPRGFDVIASPDGVDFTNVIASGTPGDVPPPGNITVIDFAPVAVRTLLIRQTGTSASWWSIHELGATCQISDGQGGLTTDVTADNLHCQLDTTDGGTPADSGTSGDGGPSDGSPLDGATSDASPPDGSPPDGSTTDGSPSDGNPPDGGGGPFDRASWTLTASSTSAMPADIITNAIDGKATTRWSSGVAQAPGQFFKVDLGSAACIGQLKMTSPGTDFIAGYTVSVSADDVTYVLIAKGVGASVTQIRLPPHTARYVRIDETGSSASWWSIDELTITP